ncbi:accessory Sec system S-layer assembly protein [Thalassobacillus sp. CUG 92003]|uniref:accessory Sec system S-layer assembly protein n=1 Tax=Thalassobacillus sp. CUG 92003 TaxID=2736641 RepID=UPI0015E6C725|nr:accessory Sec system S-layer assembly protein [Thalassobacillus sp. CUG 92003]
MFKFLKKKNQTEDETSYDPSAVNAAELTDVEDTDAEETAVYPELSFHPDWQLAEEETYVYRFWNNDLPPLKPNQISIQGVDIKKENDTFIVDAFVRNALPKSIQLKETGILLLDKQGNRVARKTFELGALGELPGHSSRPWTFTFDKQAMTTPDDSVPVSGWQLAFELKKASQKHALELEQSWQQSLATEDVEKLKTYVEQMKPPRSGEVNFLGLQAKQADNGNLHVTMLIRNGSEKGVTLQKLPLKVEDATGSVIAEGGFKLDDLEVKANTSKPWTFIFPESMIKSDAIDLSKWKAYPVQN